jgi:hypothetical protein
VSRLAGLEYVSYVVEASAGSPWGIHEAHHRTFGADGTTAHAIGSGSPVEEHAELIAEQGDTLSILITGADGPRTVALTILSPTAGELTITAGAAWARCVVALLGLPASHHDH